MDDLQLYSPIVLDIVWYFRRADTVFISLKTVVFHLKIDVPASIGIVFEDSVSEALVERFERGLSCYCDFRKYSKDDRPQKPLRPPPPYQLKEGSQEDVPRGMLYLDASVILKAHLRRK